jgi:hypothetical protein
LTDPQSRVGLSHFDESVQDEVQLYRHRLLTPQRSVVVEHGYTVLDRDLLRGPRTNSTIARFAFPARQLGNAASAFGLSLVAVITNPTSTTPPGHASSRAGEPQSQTTGIHRAHAQIPAFSSPADDDAVPGLGHGWAVIEGG